MLDHSSSSSDVESDFGAPRYINNLYIGTSSLLNDLSAEVLQLIFDRAVAPSFLISPRYAICEDPWLKAMEMKTTLPLVCHSWYNASIGILYADIGLRSVGQVAALADTIEKAPTLAPLIKSLAFACYVAKHHEAAYTHDAGLLLQMCKNLWRVSFIAYNNLDLGLLLPLLHPDVPDNAHITHLDVDIHPGCEVFINGNLEMHNAPLFATLRVDPRTIVDLAAQLVELRLPLIEESAQQVELHFPVLRTFSCEVNKWGRSSFTYLARGWRMPVLENLTISCITRGQAWRNVPFLLGDGNWMQPFIAENGPHLRYLHIRTDYDYHSCDFTFDIQPILDVCPLLEHIVLPPHAKVPQGHLSLRWIDTWEPSEFCQMSSKVRRESIWGRRFEFLREEGDADEVNEATAGLPAFRGMRTIDCALCCLRDIQSILQPCARDAGVFEFPGVMLLSSCIRVWRGDLHARFVGNDEDSRDEVWSRFARESPPPVPLQPVWHRDRSPGISDTLKYSKFDDEGDVLGRYYPSEDEDEEDRTSAIHSSDSDGSWVDSDSEPSIGEGRDDGPQRTSDGELVQWMHEEILAAFRQNI
ncbi:uncharacterized protein SCHCODRAFT_02683730 [Schizophyllum commune H4-8]|uniref:uncharacterized protein n=1 Tax=Schizophyllum commune (strain H4-8 / FGSC 9210) TaxID=578458 RepID=UPI0021602F7C|nr:uncharacterized protein SCHCODRAFT_02683730 [Schizophyllum commune H4-8]KAI5897380.1 hypothetical protein SCHCODRAFT_02683730 [Schizophyllum commune H4-8]